MKTLVSESSDLSSNLSGTRDLFESFPNDSAKDIVEENVEAVTDFAFLGSKISVGGDCSNEFKDIYPLEESCDEHRP